MQDLLHQTFEFAKAAVGFFFFTIFIKYIVAKWAADVLRSLLLRLLLRTKRDIDLYWEYRHRAAKRKPSDSGIGHALSRRSRL